ncbi:MAG: L,D-transpeptidase family protein [Candidatus Omnitrophica bacterium]|nr:L,D-transpeptidase family protein [Candidatus Omnitrophota bacterium]MDD5351691.1 L,D-transpeptidase family protein [Candidatus Omnitrophota bacterium]MDD5550901.1 L,D-transpeptidase family protein [Candidatus Omnitrophota bacterium]
MKPRFLIIIAILLVVLISVLLPRFIKRDMTSRAQDGTAQVNIDSYLKQADAFTEHNSLLEAKEIYKKVMDMSLSSEQMSAVQAKLEDLNIKILLSGVNNEQSQVYEVKPGDTLIDISRDFNVTVDSIIKANNIKDNMIYPAMKLKILKGKFSIYVDKSQNILLLKFNDEVIKTYNVSTGKNNCTPVGTYKIVNKILNPPWYKDGKKIPPSSPENILGSRWLGFDIPGYGIHGTTQPDEIGKQITEGCVRMRNSDVEEVYSLVPVNTEVTIVD